MPWCPICKNEYQEGIERCADCDALLVDELPEEDNLVPLSYISDEALAGKLVDYLDYNSISSECEYSEEEESFCIKVDPKDLAAAKSAFRAFYQVESLNPANIRINTDSEDGSDPSEDGEDVSGELENIDLENLSDSEKELLSQALVSRQVYKPAEVYVKKADESKDMFSTAITFLVFALLLVVFIILNALNIITLFNNIASLAIMGVLALGCCLVGINAIKRSRKAEIESYDEDKLTASVKEWLENNVTDDLFTGLNDPDISEEVLYLRRTEIIRKKLFEAYPDINEDFVDALLDDFYDTRFSGSEGGAAAD